MTMSPPPHPVTSSNGFTLIELLVVISIIAILITVTVPIFKMVSDGSNSARSLTNLRNIGTVLKSYTAENDSRYPAVESEEQLDWTYAKIDLREEDLGKLPFWVRAVIHHSAESDADVSRRVFGCTGLRWKAADGKKMDPEDILLAYGCTEALYGFDSDGSLVPTIQRSSATIENQPNTIMVVETKQEGSQTVSYPSVSWDEAQKDFANSKTSSADKVDFRFKKAVNCLMADGSARNYRHKDGDDLKRPHWTGEDYDSIR